MLSRGVTSASYDNEEKLWDNSVQKIMSNLHPDLWNKYNYTFQFLNILALYIFMSFRQNVI